MLYLWDDVFWFFGHPEVYVVLLPAFGMVTEIIPVFSGRPLAERNIILAVTGAVVVPLSYLVWEHHMFITGVTLSEDEAFSVATLLISLPFDIIILAFVKSLAKSSIRLTVPMAFAIGSIVLFIIGGITGVFLSSFVLDVVFRGTYFVVAHFHYVMVGAAIFGLFGGIYYYLPKMTGRLYHENMARAHFIMSFIGFNVLYFPMFFLIDMPRRVYTYQSIPLWNELNTISTIGAFVFALAQILLIWNLVYTLRQGRDIPAQPMGGHWSRVGPEHHGRFERGGYGLLHRLGGGARRRCKRRVRRARDGGRARRRSRGRHARGAPERPPHPARARDHRLLLRPIIPDTRHRRSLQLAGRSVLVARRVRARRLFAVGVGQRRPQGQVQVLRGCDGKVAFHERIQDEAWNVHLPGVGHHSIRGGARQLPVPEVQQSRSRG